jgi:hypothetical protein
MLIPTNYKSKASPTVQDLFNYYISGTIIGSGYDRGTTMSMQPGIEALWPLYPAYGEFFFGLVQKGIDHKDLINFKDRFEKVGTLKIKDSFKQAGSKGGFSDFGRFEEYFIDYDNNQRVFGYKNFPVKALCE